MSIDKENRALDVIDDALQSFPLAPVPGRLQARVMRNVQAHPRQPAFAFPWLEGSLGLLAAVMLTVLSYLLLAISPISMRLLQQEVGRFLFTSVYGTITLAAVAGFGLTLVFAALAAVIFAASRPRSAVTRYSIR